jgi:hypothetical protein
MFCTNCGTKGATSEACAFSTSRSGLSSIPSSGALFGSDQSHSRRSKLASVSSSVSKATFDEKYTAAGVARRTQTKLQGSTSISASNMTRMPKTKKQCSTNRNRTLGNHGKSSVSSPYSPSPLLHSLISPLLHSLISPLLSSLPRLLICLQ